MLSQACPSGWYIVHFFPLKRIGCIYAGNFYFFLAFSSFIYFRLCWVFIAVLSLSLVAVWGLLVEVPSFVAWQSRGSRYMGSVDFVADNLKMKFNQPVTGERDNAFLMPIILGGISAPHVGSSRTWDPLGPGMEPTSPALEGDFLATGSPGKILLWASWRREPSLGIFTNVRELLQPIHLTNAPWAASTSPGVLGPWDRAGSKLDNEPWLSWSWLFSALALTVASETLVIGSSLRREGRKGHQGRDCCLECETDLRPAPWMGSSTTWNIASWLWVLTLPLTLGKFLHLNLTSLIYKMAKITQPIRKTSWQDKRERACR